MPNEVVPAPSSEDQNLAEDLKILDQNQTEIVDLFEVPAPGFTFPQTWDIQEELSDREGYREYLKEKCSDDY